MTNTPTQNQPIQYPNIQQELVAMAREDQEYRMGWFEHRADEGWRAEMKAMDARFTARLKEIVAEIGWPTLSKVGPAGGHAAWLLLQHAPEASLREEYLPLLVDAGDDVDQRHVAYLTDRVLTSKGQPQLYGTQYRSDGSMFLPPFPIEDPDHVDERREKMGLGPMNPTYDVAKMELVEKEKRGPMADLDNLIR